MSFFYKEPSIFVGWFLACIQYLKNQAYMYFEFRSPFWTKGCFKHTYISIKNIWTEKGFIFPSFKPPNNGLKWKKMLGANKICLPVVVPSRDKLKCQVSI